MRQSKNKFINTFQIQNNTAPITFSKRIEIQQNKFSLNNQRISALEQKVKSLRQLKKLKQNRIQQLNLELKQVHSKKNELPYIQQLREHFKQLKQELGSALFYEQEEQQDDVDIDNMTYQQLLELGQKIGKVSKGLTQKQFQALKQFTYTKNKEKNQCSICRQQFEQGMKGIELKCGHIFNIQCLKQWLKMEKICPLCKTQII